MNVSIIETHGHLCGTISASPGWVRVGDLAAANQVFYSRDDGIYSFFVVPIHVLA